MMLAVLEMNHAFSPAQRVELVLIISVDIMQQYSVILPAVHPVPTAALLALQVSLKAY